jgi:hypothetical protein
MNREYVLINPKIRKMKKEKKRKDANKFGKKYNIKDKKKRGCLLKIIN